MMKKYGGVKNPKGLSVNTTKKAGTNAPVVPAAPKSSPTGGKRKMSKTRKHKKSHKRH